jgi:hypothetical protein
MTRTGVGAAARRGQGRELFGGAHGRLSGGAGARQHGPVQAPSCHYVSMEPIQTPACHSISVDQFKCLSLRQY